MSCVFCTFFLFTEANFSNSAVCQNIHHFENVRFKRSFSGFPEETTSSSSLSSSCICLISTPVFVYCKVFWPGVGWHRSRGYQRKVPPLPHKCSQLFLVVGAFTGHPDPSPYQVLFDDSAFKGESFGEDFLAWLHIYSFVSAYPAFVTERHCFSLGIGPQKRELGRHLSFCRTLTFYM